jgi:tRNA(Ile)-lysidine synthase
VQYLLAISGGIDSVVLLDMLAQEGGYELAVAHFDHGIRSDSAADARFVGALAEKYHLPFVMKREELGQNASEEYARSRRYEFLRAEAKKRSMTVVTAHHADDVVETIAINLIRGTGWRGLAVLDAPDVVRPLLHLTKTEIRTYARTKRLEWVEDSTNAGVQYLRNRVRRSVSSQLSHDSKDALLKLWQRQVYMKAEIESTIAILFPSSEYSRYFLTQIDPLVAREVLRAVIYKESGVAPTRPQIERALLAVKTARPNAAFDIVEGISLRFTLRTFVVKTP